MKLKARCRIHRHRYNWVRLYLHKTRVRLYLHEKSNHLKTILSRALSDSCTAYPLRQFTSSRWAACLPSMVVQTFHIFFILGLVPPFSYIIYWSSHRFPVPLNIYWINQFRFSAIFINSLRVYSKALSVQSHQYYITITAPKYEYKLSTLYSKI